MKQAEQAEAASKPQPQVADTGNNVAGADMPLYDDEDVNDIPAFEGFTEEEVNKQ